LINNDFFYVAKDFGAREKERENLPQVSSFFCIFMLRKCDYNMVIDYIFNNQYPWSH